MRLSAYAKRLGISYATALRWFTAGKISGYRAHTGTIIVTELDNAKTPASVAQSAAIYARVSSSENKDNLESQAKRLTDYCAARGYQVAQVIKEIGSGVNDTRPKLLKLLNDRAIALIVVEHKDRLTRFGFNYIEQLLAMQDRRIEVINQSDNERDDLMQDFVSIITSFCARLYGKRKTERILAELSDEAGEKDE